MDSSLQDSMESTGQQVSAEEIAGMRHSLLVIKQAATRKLQDKDAEIEALQNELSSLKASQQGSNSTEVDALRNENSNLRSAIANEKEKLGMELDRVDSLERELERAQKNSAELKEKLAEASSRNATPAVEDKTSVDRDRRLRRLYDRLQNAQEDFKARNSDIEKANDSSEKRHLLEGKSTRADEVIAELLAVASVDVPLAAEPMNGSFQYSSSPVRYSSAGYRESQHQSWKSKAENLTTELQVLQQELRKHLNELRGDLDDSEWGGAPSPAKEEESVVVARRMRAEDAERAVAPPTYDGAGLRIEGRAMEGELLEAFPSRSLGSRFEFLWQRKGRDSSRYRAIPYARSSTYTLTPEDVGHSIECVCTPIDSIGNPTGNAVTATLKEVLAARPVYRNVRVVGEPLNTTKFRVQGQYYGGIEGRTTYQWYKSLNSHDWNPLVHADGPEYQATSDDISTYLKCEVTPVRSDGVYGQRASAMTEVIMLDPDVSARANEYWKAGNARFSVAMHSSPAAAQASKPVTLRLDKERVSVEDSTGAKLRDVVYTNDVKVLMHPREPKMFKLRLGFLSTTDRNGKPQADDVVLSTTSAMARDIIAITLFGFAQLQDHKRMSKKSWGKANREHGKTLHSTKSTSVKSASTKEVSSHKKNLTAEEKAERAARHKARKENMSPEEYDAWREERLAQIKATMPPDEFASWKSENKERKSQKSNDASLKEEEGGHKKKRRRSSKAAENGVEESESKRRHRRSSKPDDEEGEKSGKPRKSRKQEEMKAKLSAADYKRWRAEVKLRAKNKETMTAEAYRAWKKSRPEDGLMPLSEYNGSVGNNDNAESVKSMDDDQRYRRHQARKASMSKEEYEAYRAAAHEKKKNTMTDEEFAQWQAESRERKERRAAAASEGESTKEEESKKRRRRRSTKEKDGGDDAPAENNEETHSKKRRRRSKKDTDNDTAANEDDDKARKRAKIEALKQSNPEEYERKKAAHKAKRAQAAGGDGEGSKKRRRRSAKEV